MIMPQEFVKENKNPVVDKLRLKILTCVAEAFEALILDAILHFVRYDQHQRADNHQSWLRGCNSALVYTCTVYISLNNCLFA